MVEKFLILGKDKILLIVAGIVCIGAVGAYLYTNVILDKNEYDTEFETDFLENVVVENDESVDEKIKVYITGEINNPGVIELSEGDRIEDAINKAGGITENASLDKVNLAYKLEDGQKIYIPNINDKEVEVLSTENGEDVINETTKGGKININNASVEKLCQIPGVGEALAQRIIDYRTENGKFKNIEDLKNVSGIGDKKFENVKNYIEAK